MKEENIRAIRLIVSDKVRALLSRHGVSESREQVAALMKIMEASHSQIYRKMSGRSSWLEEDLYRIATHHGESLGRLFQEEEVPGAASAGPLPSCPGAWQPAKVQVAGQWVQGEAALAAPSAAPSNEGGPLSGWLLVDTPEGRIVTWHGAEAAPVSALGPVCAIRVELPDAANGGFAVFDDDPDVAESIVDALLARGMDAHVFLTTESLRACPRRFDVYIIDWFSGESSTAADLVQHLRTGHAPEATIVILTGQIQREHTESDLARLIHTHNVMVELKPMRVDLMLAKIQRLKPA